MGIIAQTYTDEFIRHRITQVREGIGQSERGMSLGMKKGSSYINNILNTDRLPSIVGLVQILDYANIWPAEFFDVETKQPIVSLKLAKRLEELAGEDLVLWLDILNKLDSHHMTSLLEILAVLTKD